MKTILISYFSAARSLGRPGILWHLMWPTLVASVVWTSLLVMNWGALADLGTDRVQQARGVVGRQQFGAEVRCSWRS